MGRPLSFPTGTTIYDPEKCFSGYTVFSHMQEGVILIDMNGKSTSGGDWMASPPKCSLEGE